MYLNQKISNSAFRLVLLSALCIGMLSLHAQSFTNDEKLVEAYQQAIDSMLLKRSTISMESAQKELVDRHEPVALYLPKAASKRLEAAQIYQRAKHATTIVGIAFKCPKCSNVHLNESSGYLIDPTGVMVTNYHVAATYAYMKDGNKPVGFFARLDDGRTFAVKSILTASKRDDLAILQLDTEGKKLPSLSLAKAANIGDHIFAIGHPKGMHYFFTQGYVNNKYFEEVTDAGNKFFREMMVVSADYATGSSGGPIIDCYGNVVGTVSNTKMLIHSDMNPSVQMVLKNTIPVESLHKLITQHR